MGKSSPKAPPAPDPKATAAAQGAANLETAIGQGWLNALNQYGPQGKVEYNQIGTQRVGDKDVPRFSQTTTLSPEQQKQYDLMNSLQGQALGLGRGVLGNVGSAIKTPFSLDGLPKAPGSGDFSQDRDLVTQALMERNQPMMDRTRNRTENQLANQGIMVGSEAYKNKQDDLARQENDFRLAAINAGGAEQSRMFGLGTQARQQGINEQQLVRSQPINEYATLLGLGGQIQTPQAQGFNPGQIANTDVMGPINQQYAGQLANWNAQNAARQNTMSSLGNLAGSLGSAWIMSDSRLKTDIKYIGDERGFPIYTFRYKGNPEAGVFRGVMAQDVLQLFPEAVDKIGDYLAVDYGKIGVEFARVH